MFNFNALEESIWVKLQEAITANDPSAVVVWLDCYQSLQDSWHKSQHIKTAPPAYPPAAPPAHYPSSLPPAQFNPPPSHSQQSYVDALERLQWENAQLRRMQTAPPPAPYPSANNGQTQNADSSSPLAPGQDRAPARGPVEPPRIIWNGATRESRRRTQYGEEIAAAQQQETPVAPIPNTIYSYQPPNVEGREPYPAGSLQDNNLNPDVNFMNGFS